MIKGALRLADERPALRVQIARLLQTLLLDPAARELRGSLVKLIPQLLDVNHFDYSFEINWLSRLGSNQD